MQKYLRDLLTLREKNIIESIRKFFEAILELIKKLKIHNFKNQ
jgi:hypothetical protein